MRQKNLAKILSAFKKILKNLLKVCLLLDKHKGSLMMAYKRY